MRTLFITLSLLTILTAETFHVPQEYEEIRDAIDAANEGDTVLVGPGSYYDFGPIYFNGENIHVLSSCGPEETFLFSFYPFFWLDAGETSSTIIEGFTMSNNYYYSTPYGCLYVENSSPMLKNLILKECTGTSNIKLENSAAYLENIEIAYGHSYGWNSEETNNYAGAIFIKNSNIHLKNIISHDNRTHIGGGLLTTLNSDVLIENGTFYYSSAHYGSIAFFNSNIEIKNSILGRVYYANVDSFDSTTVSISYSCIYDQNTFSQSNQDATVEVIYLEGNIYEDCMFTFVDPNLYNNEPFSDFHLHPDSPCIDAGDPQSSIDFDGTQKEIGALFFPQFDPEQYGDMNEDGQVNISDVVLLVSIILCENFSNEYYEIIADMNLDYNLNIIDVIQIVNVILEE